MIPSLLHVLKGPYWTSFSLWEIIEKLLLSINLVSKWAKQVKTRGDLRKGPHVLCDSMGLLIVGQCAFVWYRVQHPNTILCGGKKKVDLGFLLKLRFDDNIGAWTIIAGHSLAFSLLFFSPLSPWESWRDKNPNFSFWPWDFNNPPFNGLAYFADDATDVMLCCWEESAQGLYFKRKGIMLRERERER